MGWDVIGGIKSAATWVDDKAEAAIDSAGQAVDDAVHTAEHALDDTRKSIVDFGQNHGGVVGKALAQNVSDGIGLVEGAGLAVYDMGKGVTTLARGAGHLTSPVEWALHPERNLQRLETTGNVLSTMAKLGSPVEWALNPQQNTNTAKALWNGVTAGYQDAAKDGDWSKFAGRAVIDVGSFFIGAGEVNAGLKSAEGANAAAHVAEGLNAAAKTGEALSDAAKVGEGLNAASRTAEAEKAAEALKAAEGVTDAAKTADGVGDAARTAEAARLTEVTGSAGQNTVKWTVNAEGETVKAEATLKEVFADAPRSSAERKAQQAAADAGRDGDVGGHIIGHRFVKDQGEVNLFPQNTQFNNSAYRTMENEWAGWIDKGKQVDVEITLSGGTATRPDRVNVRYTVTDPATGDVVFSRAKPFQNEAGQTFDRVPSKDMLP